jgi:hypothetical protein
MAKPLRLDDGKIVGQFEGDTATFPVRRSKHYFRYVGGYTLDADLVRRLPADCSHIVFDDQEIGQQFRVELMDFIAAAVSVEFGFGRKLCAPDSIYEAMGAQQIPLFLPPGPERRSRQEGVRHG